MTDSIKLKDAKRPQDDNDQQSAHLLSDKENSSSPTPPPAEEAISDPPQTPSRNDLLKPSVIVANLETLVRQSSKDEEGVRQSMVSMSSEELASNHQDLPHRRSQHSIAGATQDDVPASQLCTQPSIHLYSAGQCGSLAVQPCVNPTAHSWGSPHKEVYSYYSMPLLECNESPTASTSTVTYITQNSEEHETTGAIHRQPPTALQRRSSLPNPPRPSTSVPQYQRLHQSPQLQRSSSNNKTNTVTSSINAHNIGSRSSLAPDNDLEYQRQQQVQQWGCPTRMNSSDSAHSTLSQTSTMNTRTPPTADSSYHPSILDNTNIYDQAHHARPPSYSNCTVTQHQPVALPLSVNIAESQYGQNFHRQGSGESTANSVFSLTTESKPESGHQTGTMLVTGAYN